MKALIIRKEWLDQILNGTKTWEMRSRPTKVRGRILLIEAGSGHIVGECVLYMSPHRPITDYPIDRFVHKHKVAHTELIKKWCYAWMLDKVERYDKPIPYDHPRGAVVWVNIEDELLTAHGHRTEEG
jgi:hypothetical protein